MLKTLRPVRSYVRRESRITAAQKKALADLAEKYFIPAGSQPLDIDNLFGRKARTVLEIGFGDGKSLALMAEAAPETNFLGIEVHRPGIGNLLQVLELNKTVNVRICNYDATELIKNRIPDASLDAVHLFFPDPWPKKRHHKRRLVQQAFLLEIARILKPGGIIHMATDWQHYAEQMMLQLNNQDMFRNTMGLNNFSPRPAYRPETKFERRGLKLGHKVRDILFERV